MPKSENKGNRQWMCYDCDKSFSRKGDLTRHESLHQGIKPHICNTCRKPFSQYSGLKTHMNVHTGAKPYVCNFGNKCDARFGDPSSCARHRKETHRRLAGFHCPVPRCNSKIKRRSAFCSHLRKHGIDPTSVDVDSLAPPLLPSVVPILPRRVIRPSTLTGPIDIIKTEVPESATREADREFYHPYRTIHPSDLGHFGVLDPYHHQIPSTPSTLPSSSVSSTFSQLTTSSRTVDYDGTVSPRWDDFSEYYTMDSPTRPLHNNLHTSAPASPSRHMLTTTTGEPFSHKDVHTVNLSQGALTFDHFSFPSAYNSYVPSQKSQPDVAPDSRASPLPFYTIPSSETAWTFS